MHILTYTYRYKYEMVRWFFLAWLDVILKHIFRHAKKGSDAIDLPLTRYEDVVKAP